MADEFITLNTETAKICRQTDILATESQKLSDKQSVSLCDTTFVRNQKVVSFSSPLLLLLAACGGGGGGGGGGGRTVGLPMRSFTETTH